MKTLKKTQGHFKSNPKKMHKTKLSKLAQLLITILLTTLILSSCSKDDGDNFTPSASNINTIIDENPSNGTIIGTVATNLTGTLNYTITSQSVSNSFNINASTGVVAINDATNFDFETNAILTASVSVTNSSETASAMVTVDLNDIDDIASFLSTSKQAYVDAGNGDWILVTEDEYNYLATAINNVSKVATSDEEYEIPASNNSAGLFTFSNNNGSNIPAQNYLFAFKYKASSNNINGVKVKQTDTNINEDYIVIGNDFPMHNQGDNYFVLKGSDAITLNEGYVAITATFISFKDDNTKSMRYASGDVNTLTNSYQGYFYYQGLCSTQKQWD